LLKKLILSLALSFPLGLLAQSAPPGGQPLLAQTGFGGFNLTNSAKGKAEAVSVEGQPFTSAIRLTALVETANVWDIQYETPVPAALQAGDVILAEFWMKADDAHVESGEAKSAFVYERLGEPWTKSVEYALSAGPQWRHFFIPFTAAEGYEAGKSHICFRMGDHPQSFELAAFKITNYGSSVQLSDLPQTRLTYEGAEADAPWRQAALARIEKIRKGDLIVTVQDASGQLLPNVKVTVRMKRHAFGFGTAVVAQKLAVSGGENDRYQKEVDRLFNRVVFENDLKWGPWEEGASNRGYWRREYVEGAMDWLRQRHFDVRGHNMIWGTWRYLPATVKALSNDPKALEAALENRIQDVGGTMQGQLAEWDVVNEPVPEHQLTDILGDSAMVTWYQKAREVDPKPILFVNDYPDPASGHLKNYDRVIRKLLDQKAPLGGIGLQGHVGNSPWSIPELLAELDQLGAHGLPVEITEYDTQITDPDLDGKFMADFLTAVFSHPSVNGFLMWGFWDGAHWHKKAPVFTEDWTEKPSGKAFEQLVLHDWWTNLEGRTDARGAYQARGFLGDYEVTATDGSKTRVVQAKLTQAGLTVPVTLK
jgi:GH35 family endo-1,4-beta-xylanase